VKEKATVARFGRISRARVTQIMNLLFLAPDLQERLLFLPEVHGGRSGVVVRDLQPITREPCWERQRQLWKILSDHL
jgi:hypothetical protein